MPESLNSLRLSPRPFAAVRLIAADLDGSLVESNSRQLAERLNELLRSVIHLRTTFTIATGRTLGWITGIEPLAQLLGWHQGPQPATPAVLYNGSVVALPSGPLVHVARIEPASFAAVLAVTRQVSASLLAYSGPGDSSLFSGPRERVLGFGPPNVGRYEVNGIEIEWQANFTVDDFSPVAILIPLRGVSPAAADDLDAALSAIEGIGATRSGDAYIEVRPFGSDKATGLSVVAERLGVSPAHVLAIGDNDNDVEMLRWAGIGVSVSAASPRAIEASDFICAAGRSRARTRFLA